MMRQYLTRWNEDGKTKSAILTIFGIHRLMSRFHEDGKHLQVAVYKLAESDVYMPPIPLRPFYDWKHDKVSLFDMSGGLVEKVEKKKSTPTGKKEAA